MPKGTIDQHKHTRPTPGYDGARLDFPRGIELCYGLRYGTRKSSKSLMLRSRHLQNTAISSHDVIQPSDTFFCLLQGQVLTISTSLRILLSFEKLLKSSINGINLLRYTYNSFSCTRVLYRNSSLMSGTLFCLFHFLLCRVGQNFCPAILF